MNHYCAECQRDNLPESAFDFTATGRRKKYCRRCCLDRRCTKAVADMKRFRLRRMRTDYAEVTR